MAQVRKQGEELGNGRTSAGPRTGRDVRQVCRCQVPPLQVAIQCPCRSARLNRGDGPDAGLSPGQPDAADRVLDGDGHKGQKEEDRE